MRKKTSNELELKVEMDVGELRALQAIAAMRSDCLFKPTVKRLRSIYFDTPDYAIRKAGMLLRVRDVDGVWVQTLKAMTIVKGGVYNPIESECVVSSLHPQPDLIQNKKLRAKLLQTIDGSLLLPMFETVVERTTYPLRTNNGAEAELAVDMGHVFSDKGLEPIGEAELELKSGKVDDLILLAEDLFDGRRCKLASRNKATLGYVLIGAEDTKTPQPKRAALPSLVPGQRVETAFIQQADAIIEAILHNWRVMTLCDDPEGPHQLRISLRLLRSLLDAVQPTIDSASLRYLDQRARDLGRLVGHLRDMDVLIADIFWPVVSASKHGASDQERILAGRLKRYRDMVRKHVLDELEQWTHASFQVELALLTKQKPWRSDVKKSKRKEPVDGLVATALDESHKRAKQRGDQLSDLSLEERHAMRKSLKTLRYQGQIFGSLYEPEAAKQFNKRLKALQDIFGYLNDVVMAEKLSEITRLAGGSDADDTVIVEGVLKAHKKQAKKAWKKAQKRWYQFNDANMFWH